MPKLRHYEGLRTARAVNFSCYRRMRLLRTDDERRVVIDAMEAARTKYGFLLLGYVLMPNHVHVVIVPPENESIGRIVAAVKVQSAKTILRRWRERQYRLVALLKRNSGKSAFWQKRCYDHNCRTIDSVRERIHYCHMNPVKACLVREPGEWMWSSYNWYSGCRDVPISIDETELS